MGPCDSAPKLAYAWFNKGCQCHLRSVPAAGESCTHDADYLKRCFVRYDGPWSAVQNTTYGQFIPISLAVELLGPAPEALQC